MQVSYSVELGAEDPALELPWRSDDGALRYFNLKLHPDQVLNIAEAREHPDLGAFLSRINVSGFPLETAKCDAWLNGGFSPEEEVFGVERKFVSYVDLLFSDPGERFSFQSHETLVGEVSNLLKRAPEMAAAAEFIIRHCHYHEDGLESSSRIGFCITAYITGYGDTQEEAHQRWAIALKLLQHALVQVSPHLSR